MSSCGIGALQKLNSSKSAAKPSPVSSLSSEVRWPWAGSKSARSSRWSAGSGCLQNIKLENSSTATSWLSIVGVVLTCMSCLVTVFVRGSRSRAGGDSGERSLNLLHCCTTNQQRFFKQKLTINQCTRNVSYRDSHHTAVKLPTWCLHV